MSINEQSKNIFASSYLGAIATVTADGSPWATPLHMAADDNYVYWFSEEKEVHSQNIARDSRVSLSLFAPEGGSKKQGVYVNGRAERMDESTWPDVRELLIARLGFDLGCFYTGTAYRLPIGELDTQKSTGNCWYFYS